LNGSESVDEYARALADGIEAALPGWVTRCVEGVMAGRPGGMSPDARRSADAAGSAAQTATGSAIRALLAADIDEQRTTPLALLRQAVRYPTEVLREAGVAPVRRDPFAQRAFPDDLYDLSPASLADLDPALTDLGIRWGAAKAFEHKRRHRPPVAGAQ
jgi:hypothetical protein